MRKFILSCFTLMVICATFTVEAQIQRPRLVVGLVVDQMRWDYLYYHYDRFGHGGIKQLVDEGFSCENTMINYLPTVTAIGHTSIYTGSVPSLHGIAGNTFILDGKPAYCVADPSVKGVGNDSKESRMSPRNLLASTMGDQLKLATDFKSKVIGVALKDRAAILPAGHAADAAYWWDTSAGHFVTSTYYMNELPQWVVDFNKRHHTAPKYDIKAQPDGVTMTFDMAKAVLENEKMGQGKETDFLAISVSSTDIIGHATGTRSKEIFAAYDRLDKEIADFIALLDKKYGRNNYLLFLSADHAGAHNPKFMTDHKIPAGSWDESQTKKSVNAFLSEKFNTTATLLPYATDYSLWINRKAVSDAGLDYEKVKAAAIDFLLQDPQYAYVVDCSGAATAGVPQLIRERIVNGYNRMRNGDIMLVPHPQHLDIWGNDVKTFPGTSHGVWNPYDSHIPLIFLGWNIEHGSTVQPTFITDIAPTICALLHIQMPNASIGNAIVPVLENREK